MKREIGDALWSGGLLVLAAVALKRMTSTGAIDGDASSRFFQMAIGIMVVWTGNMIPKRLKKLNESRCTPARQQTRQRVAGWTMAIAGSIYALVWLVAPVEHAPIISIVIMGAAMLLVVTPCLWLSFRSRPEPALPDGEERP